ncbi:MAG: hypothetical protein UU47_C0002G0028 [candidate division TM6 bacterium GW2011_GWE2_41_16]|nr:MAG: hypothetical protein UU47_C0002G0028 [candidate division TM6 bacterium GW2011_GWE2_41_16]
MSEQVTYLPLARKWRSRSFDELVGQELAVKILKNSLYRNTIFPVYIFAGQRGCGKTSMARIFAAGLLCEKLHNFRQNTAQPIPCACCEICEAVRVGAHPDVIEIDAASHTGVENVRTLIEASTFLPLRGTHKIYVIDEAHMLSKAAFNAFLKVLEEPPQGVVFILATTDYHKIIDTVRSRAFHIFFDPIAPHILQQHLEKICIAESMTYEPAALALISRATQGSLRDAIMLLERVFLSEEAVNIAFVERLLGYVDHVRVVQLADFLVQKKWTELEAELEALELLGADAQRIWDQLIDVLSDYAYVHSEYRAQAFEALPQFFTHESVFIKTIHKHIMLKMICARVMGFGEDDSSASNVAVKQSESQSRMQPKAQQKTQPKKVDQPVTEKSVPAFCAIAQESVPEVQKARVPEGVRVSAEAFPTWWPKFLEKVSAGSDFSLYAFFTLIRGARYTETSGTLTFFCSTDQGLCKEYIAQKRDQWIDHAQLFSGAIASVAFEEVTGDVAKKASSQKVSEVAKKVGASSAKPTSKDWPIAAMAVELFGGRVQAGSDGSIEKFTKKDSSIHRSEKAINDQIDVNQNGECHKKIKE